MTGRLASVVAKAWNLYQHNGLPFLCLQAVGKSYNAIIRPILPRLNQQVTKHDIPTGADKRLFDDAVPFWTPGQDDPHHESLLIEAIQKAIYPGDCVVIISGGWGISTVAAAQTAGHGGRVCVFEGSARMVERTRRTLDTNDINANVIHAIVGSAIRLVGPADDAKIISPAKLPPADVLVMDCDGAEFDILPQLETNPRALVVEYHAVTDGNQTINYQPDAIRQMIKRLGYTIRTHSTRPIDPHNPQFGQEESVFIAIHDDD